MQFFIHLWTNIEYFKLLNEGSLLSQWKKDREIAWFFAENFPGELADSISPQYEINFKTLKELRKKFWKDVMSKIDGIYYGSDNCEYLSPYLKDIKQAIEEFKIFNKNYPPHTLRKFVMVTPYVWDKMMSYLEESLEYLNTLQIKNPIEIVVNDFGVLRLLTNKYTNLKPIFWRVIHKLLKTPLIDTYGYEVHPSGDSIRNKSESEIEDLRANIVKWQMKFYSSSEVSLDVYRNFLKKYNIDRVTLDFMEKRWDLYDNSRFWDVWVDLYYPWALIFTGRLCDTSAIENPSRWYYTVDDICPRTCNRYDVSYKVKTNGYKMIQRGNAGYRSEVNLDNLSEEFIKNDNNRIIYAPFVTV